MAAQLAVNGGSLNVANGYNLNAGVLDGVGTITGSLFIYGGDLQLDLAGTPENISITVDYSQTTVVGGFMTVNGTLEAYINSGGTCSTLSVGGTATLAGTLNVHNTPYTGTSDMQIITCATNGRSGTFSSINYDTVAWTAGGHSYEFTPHYGASDFWLYCVGL